MKNAYWPAILIVANLILLFNITIHLLFSVFVLFLFCSQALLTTQELKGHLVHMWKLIMTCRWPLCFACPEAVLDFDVARFKGGMPTVVSSQSSQDAQARPAQVTWATAALQSYPAESVRNKRRAWLALRAWQLTDVSCWGARGCSGEEWLGQAGDLGASPVALADLVPHLDKEGPEALTH